MCAILFARLVRTTHALREKMQNRFEMEATLHLFNPTTQQELHQEAAGDRRLTKTQTHICTVTLYFVLRCKTILQMGAHRSKVPPLTVSPMEPYFRNVFLIVVKERYKYFF